MNEDFGIQQHSAELSGASTDPKKRLTGLPRELRDRILELMLVEDEPTNLSDLAHKYSFFQVVRRFHQIELPRSNITSILRVCKQMEEEGTDLLYGRNTFIADRPSLFEDFFICGPVSEEPSPHPFTGIGLSNAAKVKSARFQISGEIDSDTQDGPNLVQLLNVLCTKLPGLQQLTLITKMRSQINEAPPYDVTVQDIKIERLQTIAIRQLLIAAARITKYHPVLRTAVWRKDSGSERESVIEVTDWSPHSAFRISIMAGKFIVDLVAQGNQAKLMGGSETKTTYRGETYSSVDIVLNSLALRQASFDNLPGFGTFPTVFKLYPSATSSEIDPEEVQKWSDIGRYDLHSDEDSQKRELKAWEDSLGCDGGVLAGFLKYSVWNLRP
ncbi:hypothetical protein H2200_006880 [Cladophialophora chaetospira]|uniref:F-box domain-containing protein n=1 Tax=Cladophialophora chaetospira TaxID=386627 RepID=A0AA38X982_9EURO|nr:hypothetical protein H2200_006880 [Cladophialophora chaetospira]